MSEVERNKGKLTSIVCDDVSQLSDEEFDAYFDGDKEVVIVGNKVYSVEWEVKRDTDTSVFADVKINPDGTIDFHTMHYNGSASLGEVIERGLKGEMND